MNALSEPASEIRQRWRIVVRRGSDARHLSHRDVEAAWEEGLRRAGLPVAVAGSGTGRRRPRVVFGAPVPIGLTAEREPFDVYLSARLTIAEMRERLLVALPPGHEIVDLHDVWVGAPSLAGQVTGADYRAYVHADAARLAMAAASLLAATSLPRAARKGDPSKPHDLRPLIVDLRVGLASEGGTAPGSGSRLGFGTRSEAVVRMRLRHRSDTGTGRPDEVLAALGEAAGLDLSAALVVRERLVLVDEA